MDVAALLREARLAVEAAELPGDLRVPGFESALRLLSGMVPEAAPANVQPQSTGSSAMPPAGKAASGSGAIAKALAISDEEVERVFDTYEGALQYAGDVASLGTTKAARVAAIGLLLIAGRQAGGYDEGPTPDAVIRTEIDRHGLFDGSNYNKHVGSLKQWANVNGAGKSATYKIKYEGKEQAKLVAATALGR